MIKAELIRFWAEFVFYKQLLFGNLLTHMFVRSGIFFLVSLMDKDGVAGLAALFFWQYATIPLSRLTSDIWEESTSGAFDQLYLHTSRPVLVFLVRMAMYSVQQTIIGVPLFLGLALLFRIPLSELAQFPWGGLFLGLATTIVGLVGFGLIVGSVVLIFRNAISYASAAEYVLLFLSGAVVPIAHLPGPLRVISPWLPLSLGIETIRRLEQGTNWQTTLVLLALQSCGFLVAGLIVFQACLKYGRRRGFAMSR